MYVCMYVCMYVSRNECTTDCLITINILYMLLKCEFYLYVRGMSYIVCKELAKNVFR